MGVLLRLLPVVENLLYHPALCTICISVFCLSVGAFELLLKEHTISFVLLKT